MELGIGQSVDEVEKKKRNIQTKIHVYIYNSGWCLAKTYTQQLQIALSKDMHVSINPCPQKEWSGPSAEKMLRMR